MREPYVEVWWQGRNLIPEWGPLVISVTLTDERGKEGDKLSIELDDLNGLIAAPEPGDVIELVGGYLGEAGSVRGSFEIDTVDEEGWPQTIIINGSSVGAKKAAKERRTEAHKKADTPTVGDLAKKIAARHGWEARVPASLAQIPITYEAQSAESDLAFLNRLLGRYGGTAAVKQGKLALIKKGAGTSASGQEIGGLVLAPGVNLKSYKVSRKQKPSHDKAEAKVFDRKKVRSVTTNAGQGEITFRFREPFKNEEEAKRAAEAALSDLARGKASASFTAEGEPFAAAEEPIVVQGIKPSVDGRWNPTRVEHKFSDGGYETSFTCEPPDAGSKGEKA